MQLTVVGCSGSVSGPDSAASCYLVQAPYQGRVYSLLLDLGPGAFGMLYRHLDPRQIDAIALSHLHPDHCLDVCAFYVAARYSPTAPWPSIPILGPADTPDRLARAYEVTDPDGLPSEIEPGITEHFTFQVWTTRQQLGPFVIDTAPADHPVEAYSIKVTEQIPGGGSLVFSGDTGPTPALVELAAGVDLLLCEAAFVEAESGKPGLHLTGRQAAEHAAAAGVSMLVLTHIPPWHDRDRVLAEATGRFAGTVQLAEPGASWSIGAQ